MCVTERGADVASRPEGAEAVRSASLSSLEVQVSSSSCRGARERVWSLVSGLRIGCFNLPGTSFSLSQAQHGQSSMMEQAVAAKSSSGAALQRRLAV